MDNETDKVVLEPLTIDRIKELWAKTYNQEGKPDWSHLFPYYHDQIIFQDSVQRIEGKEEFIALCNRLTDRCEQLTMDILTIAQEGQHFIFDWKMQMIFKKWPSTPIFGCTKLTVTDDNRIIEQRDYFDLWGDIFNNIPYFHRPYRRFMHRYFG
ncbi:MAG: nuclear transport factor 2 family protein [Anaerolineales bacterium]